MYRHAHVLLTLSFGLGLGAPSALALTGGGKGLYRDTVRVPIRALSVGVSGFERLGEAAKLPTAERDALWFTEALEQQVGVEETTILTGRNASSGSVADATRALLSGARPDEAVVLYLTTRGALQSKRAYLLTTDSDDTRLKHTSLPVADLKEWIRASPADQVIVFADTAHSALPGAHGLQSGPEASIAPYLTALGAARDGVFVHSAEGYASAGPVPGCEDHSLFTCALVRGLKGAADLNRDAQVSLSELASSLPDVLQEVSGGALRAQTGGHFDDKLSAGHEQAELPQSSLPARYETVTHDDIEVCLYRNDRLVGADAVFRDGDQFDMSLVTPETGYLHLLNVDPAKEVNPLFPAPGEDNRVSGGATTRVLPADLSPKITLSGVKGTEHIIVVWTRAPTQSGAQLEDLAKAHAKGDAVADARWGDAIGTKSLVRLEAPAAVAAPGHAECAAYTPEGDKDAWVLSFTLRHE